ncbi:SDR family oxidoreductase [Ilumatobacter sp.]|uniref:SDR family oxidoreductase n=1 Tax=Ilumatobacter sp. TaxID=1967498 RepID=UPI003B51D804
MTTSYENEIVVVTGASTGIGRETARSLAAKGYRVLVGVRRSSDGETIRTANIEPVILDITEPEHVESLAERIACDPDARPLRALVNNAGISLNAPVETLPLDEWRRVFEVNLFGQISVTQALLPLLHRSGGRIVNISSIGGRMAMATYGAYAGTKFALEAASDALRRELEPHGVQVVVVEPGAVHSAMGERGAQTAWRLADAMSAEHRIRYGALVDAVVCQSVKHTRAGMPAGEAGRFVADVVTTPRPRARYTLGRDAAVVGFLVRVLPDRVLDRMFARSLRRFEAA